MYKDGFKLPTNYNLQTVLNRLQIWIENFNDPEMKAMCHDLSNLALKQFDNIQSRNMNFDQEKDKNVNIKPEQFVHASNSMHQ